MLLNIHTGDWDDELLRLFGVPRNLLSEVRSGEIFDKTQLFGSAIPIAGIAGDPQAALFDQCCTKPGIVKNTCLENDESFLTNRWVQIDLYSPFSPEVSLTRFFSTS